MEEADAEVAAYIGRWRPSSVSPQAAAFARDVITKTGPEGKPAALRRNPQTHPAIRPGRSATAAMPRHDAARTCVPSSAVGGQPVGLSHLADLDPVGALHLPQAR